MEIIHTKNRVNLMLVNWTPSHLYANEIQNIAFVFYSVLGMWIVDIYS